MSASFETSIVHPAPFDGVAETYDDRFSMSSIGIAQRRSVWDEIDRTFRPGDRVLESNCGTGVDAAYMASHSMHVVACDSSQKMIAVARRRLEALVLPASVDLRWLPIESMLSLEREGPYDAFLSNFAGLNCVSDLRVVAGHLARLVKPGGSAIVCLFGCFHPWEWAFYLAQGDLKRAFRRFWRTPMVARVGARSEVVIRYSSVRTLRRMFSPYFRLKRWKGVGIAVPPSYLEAWAVRFPHFLKLAGKGDRVWGGCIGIRGLADHVVLTFERCGAGASSIWQK